MKLKYQALSLHYALSIMSEGGGRRTKMLVLLDYSVNDCHVYLRMQNIVFQRGTVNLTGFTPQNFLPRLGKSK